MKQQPLTEKDYTRFKIISTLIEKRAPVMIKLGDVAEICGLGSNAAAKNVVDNLIRDGYLERYGEKKALRVRE